MYTLCAMTWSSKWISCSIVHHWLMCRPIGPQIDSTGENGQAGPMQGCWHQQLVTKLRWEKMTGCCNNRKTNDPRLVIANKVIRLHTFSKCLWIRRRIKRAENRNQVMSKDLSRLFWKSTTCHVYRFTQDWVTSWAASNAEFGQWERIQSRSRLSEKGWVRTKQYHWRAEKG